MLLFPSLLLDSKNNNPSPQYSTKTNPMTNSTWSICYIILSSKIPQHLHAVPVFYRPEEFSGHFVVVSGIYARKQ